MKNIIFDIGNVLLDFQPEAYLQKHFNPSIMGGFDDDYFL